MIQSHLMSQLFELPNRRVFSISAGSSDRFTDRWRDEAIGFDVYLVRRTFHSATTKVLLGNDVHPNNIRDTVSHYVTQATTLDTLFFFFSGHGLQESLTFSNGKGSLAYRKRDLFNELSRFPGRRIAILSCCHGGFPTIPRNTLLLTPSRQETRAYANNFFNHLLFEFAEACYTPHALSYLITKFLTSYHNRPYGPLKRKVWEQNPHRSDLDIYEEEKRLGKELLVNYQRAFVLSTLVGNGHILTVDPSCYFPRKSR